VEDDRAHPDHAVVLDDAAVEDRPVPDRHSRPHQARKARVGVEHREVLDVRPVADLDALGIAADHRVVPDARIAPEADVAEGDRPSGDGGGWVDVGVVVAVLRHSSWISTPCFLAARLMRPLIVLTSSGLYLSALSAWLM